MSLADSEPSTPPCGIARSKREDILDDLKKLFAETREASVRARNPLRFPPQPSFGAADPEGVPVYNDELADAQLIADLEDWDERHGNRRRFVCCLSGLQVMFCVVQVSQCTHPPLVERETCTNQMNVMSAENEDRQAAVTATLSRPIVTQTGRSTNGHC